MTEKQRVTDVIGGLRCQVCGTPFRPTRETLPEHCDACALVVLTRERFRSQRRIPAPAG